MKGFWEQVGNDPVLMISAAIGVVLVLFIVLVVVVANMRIRTYKDRYINTRIDNVEKEKLIDTLQEELHVLKMETEEQKKALEMFADTQKTLEETRERLAQTQKDLAVTRKEKAQLQSRFDDLEAMHKSLDETHEALQKRFDTLTDENSKLRVNNARLLMKLETEERINVRHKQVKEKNTKT